MELGGYGFEKTELTQIAEQMHNYRGKRQQLELELSSEEFHRRYIPKRENVTGARIMANLPIVIIFIIGFAAFIISIILCILAEDDKIGFAFSILGSGLFVIYTAKVGFRLLKEELQMLVLFAYSSKPEKAMRFAKKHGISTFQDDRIRCDDRIANIKVQMEDIDAKLKELDDRQHELINEAKKREDVLRRYDIIKDKSSNEESVFGKNSLTLKNNETADTDITELYGYYDKEESFTRYIIKDLQFKLESIDKELHMIYEQFEQVKKKIFIFLCIFIIAILVQSIIPGIIGGLVGGMCFIIGLAAVFAIERACRGPVLRYLIEQESPLVSEYCFKNDITPVKYRRQEIVTMLAQNEKILNDIKEKKQSLDGE